MTYRAMSAVGGAILMLTAAVSARQAAQTEAPQQPQVFRTGVDLIPVDVSVLDSHRAPIENLQPSDFTLLEDGKPRPVVAFTRVTIPAGGHEPAVSNAPPKAPVADAAPGSAGPVLRAPDQGRLVAILFDRTIPAGDGTVMARRVATAIVDALGPDDQAAILRSSEFGNNGASQSFTADRRLLARAIASPFVGRPPNPNGSAIAPRAAGNESGGCPCGVCALDAVAAVAHAIQADPGRRKMLIFIGTDVPLQSATDACSMRLTDARNRLFHELDLSNLTVHVLDPAGLEAGGIPASANLTSRQAQAYVPRVNQARLQRQGDLAVLPSRTGGRMVTNTNNPGAAAAELLGESQSYYLLGFQPGNPDSVGKTHHIEVKVAQHDVKVIARKTYTIGQPASQPR